MQDIRERAFEFAVRIVKVCRFLDEMGRQHSQNIGQLQTFAFLLLPFAFPHRMGRDSGGDD
jgi:hypothetical protein